MTARKAMWMGVLAGAIALAGCKSSDGIVPGPFPDAGSDAGFAANSLATTGLWSDFSGEVLADGVRPYQPQFKLWSDGATKRRWIYLPPDSTIDTSNMDSWEMPVGTKLWKEFTRDGIRVETRLIERTAEGWTFNTYAWNETDTDAILVEDTAGVPNANGTDHDIPGADACKACHNRTPQKVLGFGAIQLDWQPGDSSMLTLDDLIDENLLSDAPPGASSPHYAVPGTSVQQDAFSYLHVNCGNCHNDMGAGVLGGEIDFWLSVDETSADQVGAMSSNVIDMDASKSVSQYPAATKRVDPGKHQTSQVWARMQMDVRGTVSQMPQLGSELADDNGIDIIAAWIDSM